MKPKLSDQARGKWPSILPALGIKKDFLTGRHGPCPMCGGSDRFRFDNKDGRGSWFCNQCGAGDGIELVKRVNSWDFRQAAPEIESHLGTARVIAIRQGRDAAEVRAEMNALWRGGKPLEDVGATRNWWLARTGAVPLSTELRGVFSLRCPGHSDHPGMLARVTDAEGKPANLHRTYLAEDGSKAAVPEPRRVMDISLPKGSAVRLYPATDVLGVAEGIETAEAARLLFGVPTWALLNAENMKGFLPPPTVRRLIIFGDHDASFTGQAAAFELARKCWNARKTYGAELEVEVNIHGLAISRSASGQDWNDVLMRKAAEALVPRHAVETAA